MTLEHDPWLTLTQQRAYLGGVSRTTFWRLEQEPGFPPATPITARKKLRRKSQLDKFMNTRGAA